MSPEALKRAQERFAIRFKKAVLERIEREHEERCSRHPFELKEEREAIIRSLASAGHSIAEIISATESKGAYVRRLLSLPQAEPRPRRAQR